MQLGLELLMERVVPIDVMEVGDCLNNLGRLPVVSVFSNKGSLIKCCAS